MKHLSFKSIARSLAAGVTRRRVGKLNETIRPSGATIAGQQFSPAVSGDANHPFYRLSSQPSLGIHRRAVTLISITCGTPASYSLAPTKGARKRSFDGEMFPAPARRCVVFLVESAQECAHRPAPEPRSAR